MANKVSSVVFPKEIYDLIKRRAVENRRSFSSEVIYLLELGLEAANEELVKLLKMVNEIK